MENSKRNTLAKDKIEFVSSIITNEQGNVAIFKRRKDLKLDPGKYDFCSGHMKDGEVPMQSMYRELNEEIGLKPEQIKYMEQIGIIGTPHKKFLDNTLSHIYHVRINLTQEELNQMIKSVEEPEMDEVLYLKDIEQVRKEMQKENSQMRMIYTKQMKYALDAIEQRINKRKEQKKELCEEK